MKKKYTLMISRKNFCKQSYYSPITIATIVIASKENTRKRIFAVLTFVDFAGDDCYNTKQSQKSQNHKTSRLF